METVKVPKEFLAQAAAKIKALDVLEAAGLGGSKQDPAQKAETKGLTDQIDGYLKPTSDERQPIEFLSPKEIEGRKGFQVLNFAHEVVALVLDDETEIAGNCSYRGVDA